MVAAFFLFVLFFFLLQLWAASALSCFVRGFEALQGTELGSRQGEKQAPKKRGERIIEQSPDYASLFVCACFKNLHSLRIQQTSNRLGEQGKEGGMGIAAEINVFVFYLVHLRLPPSAQLEPRTAYPSLLHLTLTAAL